MGRKIKINCKRVYETGLKYAQQAELIRKEQSNLNSIAGGINAAWNGEDGNNFLISFNKHIESLNNVIDFLNTESSILKANALEHSNIDIEFTNKMKRSGMND